MSTYSTSPLYNYINVQIIVNSQSSKYYFPDTPQLRPPAKIQAISFYDTNSGLTYDYNNVGLLANNTDTPYGYLTLYSSNEEAIQNIPLSKLINTTSAFASFTGGPFGNADGLYTIENLSFDLSKSFVSFSSGHSLPAGSFPISLMFGFYYTT